MVRLFPFFQFCGFYFEITPFQMEQYVNVSSDCCSVSHILRLHQFISNVKGCFHLFIGMCAIVIFFFLFSPLDSHISYFMYYNLYKKCTACACMMKSPQNQYEKRLKTEGNQEYHSKWCNQPRAREKETEIKRKAMNEDAWKPIKC